MNSDQQRTASNSTLKAHAQNPSGASQRILGMSDAAVVVAEYSDLRCSDSARACHEYLPRLRSQYFDKIRYELHAFPLDEHPDAKRAEAAARAAGEQGKYLEYRIALFDDMSPITDDSLAATSARVGAKPEEISRALASGKHDAEIQRERAAAQAIGVRATPTFIVSVRGGNGEAKEVARLKNPKTFEELSAAIDSALSSSRQASQ